MNKQRNIEVFSAGCPACDETVQLVKKMACSSCDVTVLDMNDITVAKRAKSLGVRAVPAVAIDGKLAACCSVAGVDEQVLRDAGLGKPL